MSDSKAQLAHPLRGHRWTCARGPSSRPRTSTIAGTFAIVLLAITGCGDFHLSTSNPDISPSPAVPGDIVIARFILNLIPTQRHTIIVFIDNAEHMRVTSDQAPAVPVVLELGDAAVLIARYGTGAHSAYFEVHANEAGETTRTQSTSFELQEGTR